MVDPNQKLRILEANSAKIHQSRARATRPDSHRLWWTWYSLLRHVIFPPYPDCCSDHRTDKISLVVVVGNRRMTWRRLLMRALIGGNVNDAANMETRGGVLLEVEVDTYLKKMCLDLHLRLN